MIFTIVAPGDSSKDWIRRGTVIGSNDAEKWGRPVDILVLVNAPHKFKERLNTIKKSKAKVLTNAVANWKPYFPNCEKIQRLISFNKLILKNFVYSSQTTPIICLSLAIKMGAKEIIMWGVDFRSHSRFRQGTKSGDREIQIYLKFFRECSRLGVNVYRGADGSVFDNHLPLWTE